jgi:hypothetical protein
MRAGAKHASRAGSVPLCRPGFSGTDAATGNTAAAGTAHRRMGAAWRRQDNAAESCAARTARYAPRLQRHHQPSRRHHSGSGASISRGFDPRGQATCGAFAPMVCSRRGARLSTTRPCDPSSDCHEGMAKALAWRGGRRRVGGRCRFAPRTSTAARYEDRLRELAGAASGIPFPLENTPPLVDSGTARTAAPCHAAFVTPKCPGSARMGGSMHCARRRCSILEDGTTPRTCPCNGHRDVVARHGDAMNLSCKCGHRLCAGNAMRNKDTCDFA